MKIPKTTTQAIARRARKRILAEIDDKLRNFDNDVAEMLSDANPALHFTEMDLIAQNAIKEKFKEIYFDIEGCNSYHHMGCLADEDRNGIEIVATANTDTNQKYNYKIVEIAESEEYRFVFAAFHPEIDYKYGNIASIKVLERFKSFLE